MQAATLSQAAVRVGSSYHSSTTVYEEHLSIEANRALSAGNRQLASLAALSQARVWKLFHLFPILLFPQQQQGTGSSPPNCCWMYCRATSYQLYSSMYRLRGLTMGRCGDSTSASRIQA